MLEVAVFDSTPEGIRLLGRTTDAGLVRLVRERIAAREQRKLDKLRAEPSAEPPAEPE
jgi:hypothetical protein